MREGISIIMKYLEGMKEGRMKEGKNEHYNEKFRRNEGRMKEGRNEHPYEIFRRKERRMKEGMSIIMKYLEGRKEQ